MGGWAASGLWFVMGMAAALIGGLAVYIGVLNRGVRRIREGTERFANGELSVRWRAVWPVGLRRLVEAMNQMAQAVEAQLLESRRRRHEVEAILRSMVEGVIVIDLEERVKSMNRAATRLLGMKSEEAEGRSVLEVVRDLSLQRFVSKVMAIEEPIADELSLQVFGAGETDGRVQVGGRARSGLSERLLQVQGGPLRDNQGRRAGAIIVLHDVTRLRRLESVRRDFVANVSHEIKTPVTAIKASVETMLDDLNAPVEDRQHFLGIMGRQANRLQAIIDDLLSLARIEEDAENRRLDTQEATVLGMLQAAVETCQPKARSKSIEVRIDCPAGLRAMVNAPLLEQAVVNLLDNAVKYSPGGSEVQVAASRDNGELVLSVADHGCGIASEHLPRLFERFYRTDKARSRALGGTGLGLAIVKHIAQAHGGRVAVESEVGEGSTFRLHLPMP